MVPDLSRRQLLAGVGLGTAGVAGATTQVHVGPVGAWTASVGTWPHDRYDLRNSAANLHAEPPDDPEVAWRADPIERVESIVVGPERVYVGGAIESGGEVSESGGEMSESGDGTGESDGETGDSGSPGVAALDRTDGELVWTADAGGATLALRRGTLYAAAKWGESRQLVALDAATGDTRWESSVVEVRGVVVADGTVFAGSHYRLTALDAESGRTRWTGEGGLPAVADGALFVSGGGMRRHRPHRVSDVLTHGPPPVAWDADGGGGLRPPVVANSRAVVGQGIPPRSAEPSAYAFDADTGERGWAAFAPSGEDFFPVLTGSPAVAHGRGFLSYREGQGSDRYHALVACSLDDGDERWRWESTDWVTTVAVGGETVLAGTAADPDTPGDGRNRLVAFTLDGDRKWSFAADRDVRAVASVDRTVFVGTEPSGDQDGSGAVYALR